MVSSPRRRLGRCRLKTRCSRERKRRSLQHPTSTFSILLLTSFTHLPFPPLLASAVYISLISSSSFPIAPIFLASAHIYLSYTLHTHRPHCFFFYLSTYTHIYIPPVLSSIDLQTHIHPYTHTALCSPIYPFRFSSPHTPPPLHQLCTYLSPLQNFLHSTDISKIRPYIHTYIHNSHLYR